LRKDEKLAPKELQWIPQAEKGVASTVDALQMAASERRVNRRHGGGNLLGLVLTKEDKAEGEVEVFFKQLWWVPHSPSTRVSQPPHNLFWVWSDLWESKTFHVGDLHPVQPRDTLSLDPKVCTFVAKIWGKGERESFVQVLKNSMAGRENKGRGRGCGGRKDFWADQNWWNPNYPPPPSP
jgi:hypothetical protein